METAEIKLRCLELAASVAKSHANSDPKSIVEISDTFYNHVQAEDKQVETPVRRGKSKKDNPTDILG